MDNSKTIDPDRCAVRAEASHQELCKIGRRQIDAAVKIGELMRQARDQLGHGKFGRAFNRWKDEGMVTFSDRSARRWMLIAKHAEAIKSAKLATLQEAEQRAQELENGVVSDPERMATLSPKDSLLTTADALVEFENHLIKTVRKLPAEERSEFLRKAGEIVRRRLELAEPL